MKLLFIENRYKTYTFEAIANNLSKEGHEVAFIIQNKDYTPKSDVINYIIPYPKKIKNKHYKPNEDVEKVIASDRMQNFFQKKRTNYFHYYNEEIDKILEAYKPDFVFGESTVFHELLVINNCKKRNILYLHPCTCRYPKNRFSFYKHDTLEPYKGSNEILDNEKALKIINTIAYRTAKPDYMKAVRKKKTKTINDKLLKIKSYFKGDTYNTPSPIVKFQLEKQNKKNIEEWDKTASKKITKNNHFIVLYPLQMQPEANIDVWGFKHKDQLKLIKDIKKTLSKNTKLVVKPNPKSKYELSKELVLYIKNNPKIITLKHNVKMDDILEDVDLVVTVTGTIAIECILSNKPVVTLVKTLNNDQVNCKYLDDLNTLPLIINEVKEEKFPTIKDSNKIDYLNTLNSTSYNGRFSDPFSFTEVVSGDNLKELIKAFKHVLIERK